MAIEHHKIIDTLTRARSFWEEKKELKRVRPPEREETLALQFKRGQKVRDKVTGEEVEIIGGTREIVTFSSTRGERS